MNLVELAPSSPPSPQKQRPVPIIRSAWVGSRLLLVKPWRVELREKSSDQIITTLPFPSPITHVCPLKARFVALSSKGEVYLCSSNKIKRTLNYEKDLRITCLDGHLLSNTFLVGNSEGWVFQYNYELKPVRRLEVANDPLSHLALSEDIAQQTLVVVTNKVIKHRAAITAVGNLTEKNLAKETEKPSILFKNFNNGQCLAKVPLDFYVKDLIKIHKAVAVIPLNSPKVPLFSYEGELLAILKGHKGMVLALSKIGENIVTSSRDRTIRLWKNEGTQLACISVEKDCGLIFTLLPLSQSRFYSGSRRGRWQLREVQEKSDWQNLPMRLLKIILNFFHAKELPFMLKGLNMDKKEAWKYISFRVGQPNYDFFKTESLKKELAQQKFWWKTLFFRQLKGKEPTQFFTASMTPFRPLFLASLAKDGYLVAVSDHSTLSFFSLFDGKLYSDKTYFSGFAITSLAALSDDRVGVGFTNGTFLQMNGKGQKWPPVKLHEGAITAINDLRVAFVTVSKEESRVSWWENNLGFSHTYLVSYQTPAPPTCISSFPGSFDEAFSVVGTESGCISVLSRTHVISSFKAFSSPIRSVACLSDRTFVCIAGKTISHWTTMGINLRNIKESSSIEKSLSFTAPYHKGFVTAYDKDLSLRQLSDYRRPLYVEFSAATITCLHTAGNKTVVGLSNGDLYFIGPSSTFPLK